MTLTLTLVTTPSIVLFEKFGGASIPKNAADTALPVTQNVSYEYYVSEPVVENYAKGILNFCCILQK